MSASTMTAEGLVYAGTATVTSGTVTLEVLRFTMTGASLTGISAHSACLDHSTLETRVPSGAVAAAAGPISLDVTSITATIGGSVMMFTPASPPTEAFPSPLTMSGVSMWATSFAARQLGLPGMSTVAAAC